MEPLHPLLIRKSGPPHLRTRTVRMHLRSLEVHFVSTREMDSPPPPPDPAAPRAPLPGDVTLGGVGEDALIADLLAQLRPVQDQGPRSDVFIGAAEGDDCAILRAPGEPDRWRLLKTDCVIEGIHFAPDAEPERVGWKALCRVVSDFAAMGGAEPAHALVTVALRRETPLAYARGLYAGLGRAGEAFGVRIVGGETARSPGPAFLSVALAGTVPRRRCVRRGGGRAGDALFVTGQLGGSFASGRHLDFTPRLREARWLTARFPVHAMMDLSDGLGADLPRLARASRTGFRLEPGRLPLAPGCDATSALNDGEDYELLFALAPRHAETLTAGWAREFPDLPLSRVGELTAPGAGGGTGASGFDHFR